MELDAIPLNDQPAWSPAPAQSCSPGDIDEGYRCQGGFQARR